MNGMYGYGNCYGYAPPYTPQMGTGAQMPQRCQVIKVNGRNGADAFRMAADSSVKLLAAVAAVYRMKFIRYIGFAFFALHYSL